MLRQIKFYSICIALGLSVVFIFAGQHYIIENTNSDNRRNFLNIEDEDDTVLQAITKNHYNGWPNIDKLLDKMRSKIELDMWYYNYSYSGVHKLEDLLMETGGQPLRSLIVSTWRSGSTFVGSLLNAMPCNYYHYEPLYKYRIIGIRGPPHADKALSTIKNMFKCNYDGMEDYFEFGRRHLYDQFSNNTRLWEHCKRNKELCLDRDFTAKFCKIFPFQSMKVVRISLHLMQDILQDKELNVKIVLLIRDPRGVMQSRRHEKFCQRGPDCWRPESLCTDMISNYEAGSHFLQLYPDRFKILRFEDLALNPNITTYQLYKFLRLSPSQSIDEYLHTHTNINMAGFYSTSRISRNVPFKWKNALDFDYVEKIQIACKKAMELWGYRLAHNATHMASKDFYPLQPYTVG